MMHVIIAGTLTAAYRAYCTIIVNCFDRKLSLYCYGHNNLKKFSNGGYAVNSDKCDHILKFYHQYIFVENLIGK